MTLLRTELHGSTILSIGHRPGLEPHHDRRFLMVRGPAGATLVPAAPGWRPARAGSLTGFALVADA
jgi:putative ATP-binding cassette transporter